MKRDLMIHLKDPGCSWAEQPKQLLIASVGIEQYANAPTHQRGITARFGHYTRKLHSS